MSMFYLVLYIFIGVVAFLCVVSFVMYTCHLCGGAVEKPMYPGRVYSTEDQRLLNQTQQMQVSGQAEQVGLVDVRRAALRYEQDRQGEWPTLQSQLVTQQPVVTSHTPYIDSEEPTVMESKPYKNTVPIVPSCKPTIPVKPMIHSQPSSQRNSLVNEHKRCTFGKVPPQPPNASKPIDTLRSSQVIKPRGPPPPPPDAAAATATPVIPPPTYNEVIYDRPMADNYLSD